MFDASLSRPLGRRRQDIEIIIISNRHWEMTEKWDTFVETVAIQDLQLRFIHVDMCSVMSAVVCNVDIGVDISMIFHPLPELVYIY